MKKSLVTLLILSAAQISLTGCASFGRGLKGLLGGKTTTMKSGKRAPNQVGKIAKNKKYKRTDHETLQERSKLGPEAGSLWIERGQGAYLFTQNTRRLIGDLVNVEIEGQAKKQIETKIKVITDLVDRIKAQQEAKRLASANRGRAPASTGKKGSKPVSKKSAPPPPPAAAQAQQKFEVKVVPSQITEITKDGSYIVEGDQPFMIGKREYKLVVKGIVRQDDFDDQGISAETLLDPKFDIVTARRKKR